MPDKRPSKSEGRVAPNSQSYRKTQKHGTTSVDGYDLSRFALGTHQDYIAPMPATAVWSEEKKEYVLVENPVKK
jgi:hypothetical protein